MFDHEKLDAYRRAIGFISWATTILDEKPRRGRPVQRCRIYREVHARPHRLDGDEADRKAARITEHEHEYEYEYEHDADSLSERHWN